jgi:3-dehydroquinate synthase
MDFVHIPTTLLAMVDAAIGGKTGIDFEGLKNQIGLFAFPKAVFCFPEFLATLPDRHLASGFAEMLKHSLISDREHFNEILQCRMLKDTNLDNYILHSAKIKGDIVARDPIEKGYRKVLNLGHTIGHAIETYSLKMDMEPLLHGEAVAAGLICEVFISMRMLEFPESDLQSIASFVSWHFPHYRLRPAACSEIISYMMNDKKIDSPGKINFSLLRAIGEPVIDQYPGEKLIRESMHFYLNIDAGFFS